MRRSTVPADYNTGAFYQALKRVAKPIFGRGWTVTKKQVQAAFYGAEPEYEETCLDDAMFEFLLWDSLKPVVNDLGFQIREDDNESQQAHD